VGLYRKIPQDANYNRFSYPNYKDVRDRSRSFTGLAAYFFTAFHLSDGERTERLYGKVTSGNYFSTLGVPMALGRGFLPEEDATPGSHPVAVLGHGLWTRRFGADPAILGRSVTLNGHPCVVVGVTAREYLGTEVGMVPDLYIPMMMAGVAMPGFSALEDRGLGWLRVVGRLRPGVTAAGAASEMDTIAAAMKTEHPAENEAFGIAVISSFGIHPQFRGLVGTFLMILMVVVGLVLAIACANIAGLMLARAVDRRAEMAIRSALGAGRGRLARQLLAESLALAALGAGLAIVVAPWIARGLSSLQGLSPLAGPVDLRMDARVLLFSIAVSAGAAVLFGLVPALTTSRVNPAEVLRDASGRASRQTGARRLFVGAQVALSLTLLIASALFLRSLGHARGIDPGFDPDGVSVLSVDTSLQGYDEARSRHFFEELMQRVRALPGVSTAALADHALLGNDQDATVMVDGYTPPGGLTGTVVNFAMIGPGWLETMRIPLVRGRDFDERDAAGTPASLIINETMARRFWADGDALGRPVHFGGTSATVVGITRDAKYVTLGEEPRPYMFFALNQRFRASLVLHVRATKDAGALMPLVQSELRALDRDLPVYAAGTLADHLSEQLLVPKLAAIVLGAFGALAALLASLGVYGLMAGAVAQRTREFGIRVALGARDSDVMRLVLGQMSRLVAAGLAVGLALAIGAARFLSAFLYGISPWDAASFAAAIVLLASVALVAGYLPARRATRVDPIRALRYE
jgi:predicted permease